MNCSARRKAATHKKTTLLPCELAHERADLVKSA